MHNNSRVQSTPCNAKEVKANREVQRSREVRANREARANREVRANREARANREVKANREAKGSREVKRSREVKGNRKAKGRRVKPKDGSSEVTMTCHFGTWRKLQHFNGNVSKFFKKHNLSFFVHALNYILLGFDHTYNWICLACTKVTLHMCICHVR